MHAVIRVPELGHNHHLHVPQSQVHIHTNWYKHRAVNVSFGISCAPDRKCWVYLFVLDILYVLSPRIFSFTAVAPAIVPSVVTVGAEVTEIKSK